MDPGVLGPFDFAVVAPARPATDASLAVACRLMDTPLPQTANASHARQREINRRFPEVFVTSIYFFAEVGAAAGAETERLQYVESTKSAATVSRGANVNLPKPAVVGVAKVRPLTLVIRVDQPN